MLVWFALVLGVAAASPLVQPRALQLVCSAAGAVLVETVDGATTNGSAHTLDCALCLLANTPPRAASALPQAPLIPIALAALRVTEPVLSMHGAPLPARGPPTLA